MAAGTAVMRGTLRSFDPAVRELIGRRVGEIAIGIASGMRAEVDYSYQAGYPATINDPVETEKVREIARMLSGEKITKSSIEHARELLGV